VISFYSNKETLRNWCNLYFAARVQVLISAKITEGFLGFNGVYPDGSDGVLATGTGKMYKVVFLNFFIQKHI